MRRVENSPAPRNPRSAVAAAGASRSWLVDSKYQPVMTLVMYALMFMVSVPSTIFSPQFNEVEAEPNPLYRTLKLAMLGVAVAVLIWRRTFAVMLARELNKFLLVLLALALLSTTWSIEPGITMTRIVALATIYIICWACVMVGWYEQRYQEILRSFFTALMVGSLIFGIVAPTLAKERGIGISLEGAWHGLLAQKNGLGHAACITILLWWHAWLANQAKFWRFAAGSGAAIACLLLSRSSTSVFAALFSIGLLLLLLKGPKGKRRYMVLTVVAFAAVLLFYSLAVLNVIPGSEAVVQPLVALTGKDMTFSGRTQIWSIIQQHIAQAPILGTGYGAYWIGRVPTSPSYVFITRMSSFYPTEAHNGYLDIINDLGYVGLLCLLGFLFVFLRQSLALLKIDYVQATLYLALLFEELINNMSESEWLSATSFSFVTLILGTFALARALLDQRLSTTVSPAAQMPVVTRRERSRQPRGRHAPER
jgi:O-antigen ligase